MVVVVNPLIFDMTLLRGTSGAGATHIDFIAYRGSIGTNGVQHQMNNVAGLRLYASS